MSNATACSATTRVSLWHGSTAGSVQELVASRLQDGEKPLLVTSEPENGPSLLLGFRGIVQVTDSLLWPPTPLVEARLHYEGGMLHILKTRAGTRWSAWGLTDQKKPPSWIPDTSRAALQEDHDSIEQTVLLECGKSRRQLALAAISKVTLRQYFLDGVPRWWRLVPIKAAACSPTDQGAA